MKTLARFFRRSRCGVITAFALVLTIRAWCQAPDGNLGFMITSPSLNTYRLEWFGQSGKKFQLQSSADLSFWSNTGPVITGVGGIITAEDGPISLLRKFYRVGIIGAVRLLPITGVLPGNDDGSIAGAVPIGFTINFFGVNRTDTFVNNNGNITFSTTLAEYTPLPLQNNPAGVMIAPFWADVDTRPSESGLLFYTSGTFIAGRRAFAVTWPNVGYYSYGTNKLNVFQLVLLERGDIAAGDFDIEFNYDKIEWETGGASSSGGVDGLGGKSARVGISNGSNRTVELAGSGVNGALLDSSSSTGLIYNHCCPK